MKMNISLVFLLALLPAVPAGAEVRFSDPGIPGGEELSYDMYVDGEPSTKTVRTDIVTEDGIEFYEVKSDSVRRAGMIRIMRRDMSVCSIRSVNKGKDAVIERTSRLLEKKADLEDDEAGLVGFEGINTLMRGYPFGEREYVKIVILGNAGPPFPLKVSMEGREILEIKDKKTECYKLKMSVAGLWGKFFSKTYMWYGVEAPHCLVRYEGPTGGPGSPRMVQELSGR